VVAVATSTVVKTAILSDPDGNQIVLAFAADLTADDALAALKK
jgi:hypothetical protein